MENLEKITKFSQKVSEDWRLWQKLVIESDNFSNLTGNISEIRADYEWLSKLQSGGLISPDADILSLVCERYGINLEELLIEIDEEDILQCS